MRKKSNLDTRILQCDKFLIAYEGTFTNVNEFVKEKAYVEPKLVFKNDNPLDLDLGCGLGGFTLKIAQLNPNRNYIGVEKFSNVIIGAIDKAREADVENLKFLNCRCECLEKYIKPHSVDKIYLNFSNPLPNKRDTRHRLTTPRFLNIYKEVLKEDGILIQKTDDRSFFEYSIQMYKENGWNILDECWDLAALNDTNNIITEHEQKYMNEGKLIYRVIVKPN